MTTPSSSQKNAVKALTLAESAVHGLGFSVMPAQTYEVKYLNGTRTYTEPFMVLRLSPEITNELRSEINSGSDALVKKAVPKIISLLGRALASIARSQADSGATKIVEQNAENTIKKAAGPLEEKAADVVSKLLGVALQALDTVFIDTVMSGDGAIDIFVSYHYIGIAKHGTDPTASPVPGVIPAVWNGLVDGLLHVGKSLGSQDQATIASDVALFSHFVVGLAQQAKPCEVN